MKAYDCNWMMLEEHLATDDRIVLPVGSTEQHGYLSVGTDAILAERVAVEAAEPLGIPVLPEVKRIDAEKKKAFEALCASQDITASQMMRQLIKAHLAAHDEPQPQVRRRLRRED